MFAEEEAAYKAVCETKRSYGIPLSDDDAEEEEEEEEDEGEEEEEERTGGKRRFAKPTDADGDPINEGDVFWVEHSKTMPPWPGVVFEGWESLIEIGVPLPPRVKKVAVPSDNMVVLYCGSKLTYGVAPLHKLHRFRHGDDRDRRHEITLSYNRPKKQKIGACANARRRGDSKGEAKLEAALAEAEDLLKEQEQAMRPRHRKWKR